MYNLFCLDRWLLPSSFPKWKCLDFLSSAEVASWVAPATRNLLFLISIDLIFLLYHMFLLFYLGASSLFKCKDLIPHIFSNHFRVSGCFWLERDPNLYLNQIQAYCICSWIYVPVLSIYIPTYLSIYLSTYLPIHISSHPSIHLSIDRICLRFLLPMFHAFEFMILVSASTDSFGSVFSRVTLRSVWRHWDE